MKRLSFIILIVICITETVNAQSSTFDSSYVLLSSDIYDYKNPTFENLYDPYNVRQSDRFVYEIHSGLKSNLQIKTFTFDSEDSAISITSDNYKNINASFSGDMIVWQSNKYGKQDLFYSLFNGVSWSSPEIIDTSQGDKIQPNIHFTRYLDIYCISYQKNNDVYFKYYRGGIWSADTNLTSSINEICHTPVLKGNYYNMSVLFIQELNDTTNKVVKQSISVQFPLYNFIFYPQTDIYFGRTVKDIYLSTGHGEEFLNYELDSSGKRNVYGFQFFGAQIINYTSQFNGDCFNGRGSFSARIFEDNTLENYFFCFAFVRKVNDSSLVVVYRTINGSNLIKSEFYTGDSSTQTYCNISKPVSLFSDRFKIRLIWERILNGKTAFYESDLIDRITSVSGDASGVNHFSLSQNFPNPFNPKTIINYQLAINNVVSLKVYDALGKEVATLVNEKQNAGSYSVEFNGEGLPSGIYFYKLEAGDFVETKRMVLLK